MVDTIVRHVANLLVIVSIIYCIYSLINYIINTIKQYKEINEGDTFLYTKSFNKEIPVMVLSKSWGFILISNYYKNDETNSYTYCNPRYEFYPLFILDSVKIK